jgi:Ni/Fe-hydrogenase subunit HybB-like protein
MNKRLYALKSVLWALVGVLTAITAVRFIHGLGAVTNLSDAAPWGLWIGFDVMGGVALAAGGFVLAATVYIFGIEKYRPFVRPAILTAFLGYIAVAVGLFYDLGVPWHIWHPAIYWQYHSVLFEVAACVMLYLAVLTLEFAPVVLEHPRFTGSALHKPLKALKRITIPLVIAGIILSTLHQSSLGSLFLITPYRLHPLWYSPIMYVLFFVSAVALGLMMVVMESLLAAFFLGHRTHAKLLSGLGKVAAVVLGLYVLLRIGDLALRGVLIPFLDGSWQSLLFVAELGISAVIPAGLLLLKPVRSSIAGLGLCSALTILGMVLYRLDVCIVAFARPEDLAYFPSWMEFAVSLGIVSGAVLIFLFFVERFNVYEAEPDAGRVTRPSFDPATLHGLLPHKLVAPRRFSLITIAAAAVAVLLLPDKAILGLVPARTPVSPARTVDGIAVPRQSGPGRRLELPDHVGTGPSDGATMPLLMIDGNRNGYPVLLDHEAHKARLEDEGSCTVCHHINKPYDRNTACYECHRDMYEPTSVFNHMSHVQKLGGNAACLECHQDPEAAKSYETAAPCAECHEELVAVASFVEPPQDRWQAAVGYMHAMHGLCESCHERRLAEDPGSHPPTLDRCDTCHDVDRSLELRRMAPGTEVSRAYSDTPSAIQSMVRDPS